MRDCSLFQVKISILVMHVVRDSQPLFLLLFFSYFVPQNFFRQTLKIFGEKNHVAFCEFFFLVKLSFFSSASASDRVEKNFKKTRPKKKKKRTDISTKKL